MCEKCNTPLTTEQKEINSDIITTFTEQIKENYQHHGDNNAVLMVAVSDDPSNSSQAKAITVVDGSIDGIRNALERAVDADADIEDVLLWVVAKRELIAEMPAEVRNEYLNSTGETRQIADKMLAPMIKKIMNELFSSRTRSRKESSEDINDIILAKLKAAGIDTERVRVVVAR